MKKICFFLRSPLDYFVIKDIYKHIPEYSDIVLKDLWQAHCWHPYINQTLQYCKDILEAHNEEYVLHPLSKRYDGRDFLNDRYDVFFYAGCPPENSTMTPVRILYSLSKEKATCGTWNSRFNNILVPGKYSEEVFSKMTNTSLVGLPKFDEMFSGNLSKEKIKKLKKQLNIDEDKKTVLYLPTWGEMTTSHLYNDQINKLKDNYNVIIKMHDILFWCEKHIWSGKFRGDIPIINGNIDIQYLYQISNIIIGDYSGANYEALLSDLPIILLTRDINFDICSSTPESIDQIVRDYAPNIQINKKDELLSQVNLLLKNDTYKEKREEVKNYLFSFNDGKCGERAAEVLMNIKRDINK